MRKVHPHARHYLYYTLNTQKWVSGTKAVVIPRKLGIINTSLGTSPQNPRALEPGSLIISYNMPISTNTNPKNKFITHNTLARGWRSLLWVILSSSIVTFSAFHGDNIVAMCIVPSRKVTSQVNPSHGDSTTPYPSSHNIRHDCQTAYMA